MNGSIRYHYIIRIQFEAQTDVQQISWEHGTVAGEPGETREELFERIFRDATRAGGRNPVPLFFSLEPDDLTPEDRRLYREEGQS